MGVIECAFEPLAQRGLHVILTSRDSTKDQKAAEALRQEGHNIRYNQLDVTDPNGPASIQEFIDAELGRLDVLINAAGVYLDEGESVFEVPLDIVRTTLEINFYGPLHQARTFIPLMRQTGYSRVVNVSSRYGSVTDMGGWTATYRISKVALNALTRIVADEVRGYNIKVNAMCPGWVRTDMGGHASPKPGPGGAHDHLAGHAAR